MSMDKQTSARDLIGPGLVGCLSSILTFVIGIALTVFAGITFGNNVIIKLLPSLVVLLAILVFALTFGISYRRKSRKDASAHREQ